MNVSDVIAIVMAVLVAVLAGAVVSMLFSLRTTLRSLHRSVDALREETLPLVDELRAAVDTTVDNVDRVDRLITAAEGIEAHVDSASRLAYRTIANPVVKTMAFGSGVKRASQRLRGKGSATEIERARQRARRRARRTRRAS